MPDPIQTIRVASRSDVGWHASVAVLLLLLSYLLFFHRLGERALWSSHEGRAGQHAQRMIDGDGWGMPRLFWGEPDYQKPPLYYWLVAMVAKVRGDVVDGWSIRFPAALSAVIGAGVVYGAGLVFGSRATALLSAIFVVCNLRYSWLGRVGRIDMPLMLTVSIALLCFYGVYHRSYLAASGVCRPVRRLWVGAYVAVAAAVLFKGPIGLVLTALPMVLFLILERRICHPRDLLPVARRFGLHWGVPIILVIAGPWFLWASVATGGAFFETFFLHHHWDRTLGAAGLKPEPVWYYLPRIFLDMMPWSVLIPAAIYGELRAQPRENRFGRFAFCWAAGMFLILSLVRFKRHDYLLPLIPGLALFLGVHGERIISAPAGRKRLAITFSCTLGLAAAGLLAGSIWSNTESLAPLVERATARGWVHETDRMLFDGICSALVRQSAGLMVATLVAPGAASFGIFLLWRQRASHAMALLAIAWSAVFLAYTTAIVPVLEPIREQRSLATMAKELQPAGSELFYYGREDQQLMFYLGCRSVWLPNRSALWPVINRSEPVFVVMEQERYEMRKQDWPGVAMFPIARNTDNPLGRHGNPSVLVTNAAGWDLVRSRRGTAGTHAN